MTDASDPLVLFMPSGKRGRFPVGTSRCSRPPARSASMSRASVADAPPVGAVRSRCRKAISPSTSITSSNDHISPVGPKEKRYAEVRTIPEGRRLSCSAQILGDLVIDVPQDTVVNAQVIRKAATDRT